MRGLAYDNSAFHKSVKCNHIMLLELKVSDHFRLVVDVMTVVRASVPLMILDDVFEQKNEIANSVKEELEKV